MEAGRQPARRRRPAPPHGQFSQVHLPHLPAHEGKRSTQDEAALRGGRGASSDSPHQSSPTSHPPHPASMRSRASSDLIAGKAARRRRQRGRSGRRSRSRGEADAQRIIINSENRFKRERDNKNKIKLWRCQFSIGAATSDRVRKTAYSLRVGKSRVRTE